MGTMQGTNLQGVVATDPSTMSNRYPLAHGSGRYNGLALIRIFDGKAQGKCRKAILPPLCRLSPLASCLVGHWIHITTIRLQLLSTLDRKKIPATSRTLNQKAQKHLYKHHA